MRKELEELIDKAHETGYTYACWSDGGNVSNEEYKKSQKALLDAVEEFLEKFGSLAQR